MKNLNKKVIGGVACVLITLPSVSFAGEMYSSESNMTTTQYSQSYYDTFKKEFYEQLNKWDFSQIDKKIAGYEADVAYLSENTESEYYNNISIYKEKIEALKKLKENFKSHVKEISSEQQENLKALKAALEENIKTLRESITAENIEEIKAKAETLKTEYLAKAESLGLVEYKKMIEERFKIFFEANFGKREEMKKIAEQKKEELKKIMEEKKALFEKNKEQFEQNLKQKKEEAKKLIEEKKWEFVKNKESFQQKMQDVKQTFKDKKRELKAKYKEAFAKKLEGKIDSLSAEKLKAVLTKIDTVIEKYKANENLTAEQKEKFTAQLEAIKEIIQDKIDELENGINLDDLLSE